MCFLKNNKSKIYKIKRIAGKILIITVSGVVFSTALMMNVNTNSWFTSSVEKGFEVTAASTEDIIEIFEVVEGTKPPGINIKKTESLENNPMIYFSVTGEASQYILHINPIKLQSNNTYSIPIHTNVNTIQWVKLLVRAYNFNSNDDYVKGKIRLKYLNEYIDEEQDIEINVKYLINRYVSDISRSKFNQSSIKDINEYRSKLTEIIMSVAQKNEWQPIEVMKDRNNSIMKDKSNESQNTLRNIDISKSPKVQYYTNEFNELDLTENQSKIITSIVPGFIEYTNSLYRKIDYLIGELNKKIDTIAELNLEIKNLNEANGLLEQKRLALTEQNKELSDNIKQLEEEKGKLEKDNEELEVNKVGLEAQILSLSTENDSIKENLIILSTENNNLKENLVNLSTKNSELEKENQQLKDIIIQLQSENEDETVSESVYGN